MKNIEIPVLLAALAGIVIGSSGCGGGGNAASLLNTIGSTGTTGTTTTGTPSSGVISPMVGSTSGGTVVNVMFSGTITSATFGGVPASYIIERTSSLWDLGAPAGSGTVNVVVTSGGQNTTVGAFTYSSNTTAATPYNTDVPVGLGVDSSGRVLMCDANAGDVDILSNTGGTSGVLFANTGLKGARQFAISGGDIATIADSSNDVEEIDGAGSNPIKLFSGTASPYSGGVNGIAISNLTSSTFDYYIATPTGVFNKLGNSVSSSIKAAARVAADANDNVYALTGSSPDEVESTSSGTVLMNFGQYVTGGGTTQFQGPSDIAVDGSGNVFIYDGANGRVEKFTSSGTFLASYPTTPNTSNSSIHGIAVTSSGTLYIVNPVAGTIEVIDNA